MRQSVPLYTLKRLGKRNGIKRISSDALKEIRNLILDLTEKMTRESLIYAQHAGRMTIKEADIKLVIGREND